MNYTFVQEEKALMKISPNLPESAREEDGILRDDCDATAQVVQTQLGDVDSVDADAALGSLDHPEQSQRHRGLARSRPAHYAHFLVRVDRSLQLLDHQVQARTIPAASKSLNEMNE